MNQAFEQLHAATLCLARAGTLKERLQRAYTRHLRNLDANELPGEVRDEVASLMRRFVRERPLLHGEDAAAATIRKLSSDEADAIACAIVNILGRMTQPDVSSPRSATVVPLFPAAEPLRV
jgi:hypothetical protein